MRATPDRKPILVLDLGGVLADLGSPTTDMSLSMSDEEFLSLWVNAGAVIDFETGKLGYEEFVERLAGDLPVHAKVVAHRLPNWKLELFPQTERLLAAAAGRFRLALLSNTNVLHWSQLEPVHELFSTFERLFLSFETGLHKPDPESFLQVIRHFDCSPSAINYFDDSPTHIDAARRVGIAARRVVGPEDLEAAIESLPA